MKLGSEHVKLLALEAGFHAVGISLVTGLEEAEAAIAAWVAENRHGTMKYLEQFRQRRERLFSEMPGAKSVISLGVNYFNSLPEQDLRKPVSGKIARYAWGQDYHRVIKQKHEILIDRLRQRWPCSFQAISCVDTQPLPERYAAVRAGMGFIGKHTGLLNSRYGPWLFLSEIVTDLDLEPDMPAQGHCGTCNDCQVACPTGALDQDYRMDARRCISYLTIEHKGVIPRPLRPLMKDWLFGCDECMSACPFTSKQTQTTWDELKPDQGVGPGISFEDLFAIRSNADYARKMKGTALLRAGFKQMLRNACIVIGNSRDPAGLIYLKRAVKHDAPLVRLHAVWALGQFRQAEAVQRLRELLADEKDPEVLAEIQWMLEGDCYE